MAGPSASADALRLPASGSWVAALKNFFWMAGDKALAVVVGLFVFGLIARTYGPVGSGHFAFAAAVLQSALGLSLVCSAAVVLPRFWGQKHSIAGAIANVFAVRMAGSLFAACAVGAYVLITVQDPSRRLATLILLATTPLIEPFYTAVTYWQSRNDNRIPVLSRAAGLLARVAIVIAAVALGAPVWVLALAWGAEALISAVIQTMSLRPLASMPQMAAKVTPHRSAVYFKFGVRFLAGLWLSHVFLRLDRLILSELMSPREYGIYATAMQLVEVWLQVGTIVGASMGPAFLFAQLSRTRSLLGLWKIVAALTGLGLIGFLGALLLGRPVLVLVFGHEFAAGAGFLIAGTAFGILFFADQVVQIGISAGNQPVALALKWSVACLVALAVQVSLFPVIGGFAGPAGLAAGMCASWIALLLLRASRQRQTNRNIA
jgi:O-antigen/teichoic acid export membrane protein